MLASVNSMKGATCVSLYHSWFRPRSHCVRWVGSSVLCPVFETLKTSEWYWFILNGLLDCHSMKIMVSFKLSCKLGKLENLFQFYWILARMGGWIKPLLGMYLLAKGHLTCGIGSLVGGLISWVLSSLAYGGFCRQYKMDLRANSRAIGKLRVAAETCKRVLSTVGAAQCSVDSLYEGIDFNSTLSRSDRYVLTGCSHELFQR